MLYIKLVWMCLTAVCSAMFVYPFLHELGHLLAALFMGCGIMDFSVFPASYVMMDMGKVSQAETVVVGLCGMILPMACAMIQPRRLTVSVIIYTLRVASILAWFLSCLALALDQIGISWENEDVINVIRCIGDGEFALFLVCLIAMLLSVFLLIQDKPVSRIMSFF